LLKNIKQNSLNHASAAF